MGWLGVTTKASVPLGQSHINSWDRVARSGQLPARLQHAILALSPVTYISTSRSILLAIAPAPFGHGTASLYVHLSPVLLAPSWYLSSPRGAFEIIIPVRLLRGLRISLA